MNRNYLFTFFITFWFLSCNTSYFENDLKEFSWEGEVIFPVGHVDYSLSKLLKDLEIADIDESDENIISFSFTESFNINEETNGEIFEIEIPAIKSSKTINTPLEIINTLNNINRDSYTIGEGGLGNNDPLIKSILLASGSVATPITNITEEITSASFDAGILTIRFVNKFNSDIDFTLEIPSLIDKTSGEMFVTESIINVPANSDTIPLTINLDKYLVDLTHNGYSYNTTVNSFVTIFNSQINLKEGDEINKKGSLVITPNIEDTSPDLVYGDFKQATFIKEREEINVNFFNQFKDVDIALTDVSLTLKIMNSYGFPLELDLSKMQARNEIDTPLTLTFDGTQDGIATYPENKIIINGIPTPNYTPVKSDTLIVILNKENSNINDLISLKPTGALTDISGQLNPLNQASHENFYAKTNDGLNVSLTVDIPLDIQFENFTFMPDKIELDLGVIPKEIEQVEFNVSTFNSIPLSGNISIVFFENENDLEITKTFNAIEVAPLDSEGKSIGTTTTKSKLVFPSNEFEKLEKATHIQTAVTFNTPKDQPVKLIGSNSISIFISGKTELQLKYKGINEK